MLYEFDEPFVVDDSDFRRTFGEQSTPLKEAIGDTVRWYRDEQHSAGNIHSSGVLTALA